MAKIPRDFKADSIAIGNLVRTLTESVEGDLVFTDVKVPAGVRLIDLIGGDLFETINEQVQINVEDISDIFTLIEGLSAENADDVSLALLAAISGDLQDQIDNINTEIDGLSGIFARLNFENTFTEDNFFEQNVSIGNDLIVQDTIFTDNITISGCAKIVGAIPDHFAGFDSEGCLVDSGFGPADYLIVSEIAGLTGVLTDVTIDLQDQIDELNKDHVFTSLPSVSATTTVDFVPITETDGALWMVVVIDKSDTKNRIASQVFALHDGVSDVDFNEFSILETGIPPSPTIDVIVDSGDMKLIVGTTSDFLVKILRIRTTTVGET